MLHNRFVVGGDCCNHMVPFAVVVHCNSGPDNFDGLAEEDSHLRSSVVEDTAVVDSFADKPVVLHCSNLAVVGRRNRLARDSRTFCTSI